MGRAQLEIIDGNPSPAPAGRAGRPAARRGFTLLEILVVIGIILLLVAIGVVAFGVLDQSGKVTKTTLANLQSMLAEYQARTGLREPQQQIWSRDSLVNTNTAPNADPRIDLWTTEIRLDGAPSYSVTSGSTQRYNWGPVANTQMVLRHITRLPENKQTMTKLPSKQVHGIPDGVKGNKLFPTTDPKVIDPPLVLDAWGNPVLFVGSDGLAAVSFESRRDTSSPSSQVPAYRVNSTGVTPLAKLPAINLTNRSKSWRPFFASAGPDGDFKTGDDNVYSFEQ